jgi:hypothetical protein
MGHGGHRRQLSNVPIVLKLTKINCTSKTGLGNICSIDFLVILWVRKKVVSTGKRKGVVWLTSLYLYFN